MPSKREHTVFAQLQAGSGDRTSLELSRCNAQRDMIVRPEQLECTRCGQREILPDRDDRASLAPGGTESAHKGVVAPRRSVSHPQRDITSRTADEGLVDPIVVTLVEADIQYPHLTTRDGMQDGLAVASEPAVDLGEMLVPVHGDTASDRE
ncbi:hypothetical protein [Rhodococcus jostii]|uniref:hypothetical protein n=1 Tax=Rhodococcus jostii TaxID=132919 RepID=UPI00365AEE63